MSENNNQETDLATQLEEARREAATHELTFQRLRSEAMLHRETAERATERQLHYRDRFHKTRSRLNREKKKRLDEKAAAAETTKKLRDAVARISSLKRMPSTRVELALRWRLKRLVRRKPVVKAKPHGGRTQSENMAANETPSIQPKATAKLTVTEAPIVALSTRRVLTPKEITERTKVALARTLPDEVDLDDLSSLRVAGIVDDFTRESMKRECQFLDLHPDSWEQELRDFRPHLLFVESAWRGHEGSWHNSVSRFPEELQGILQWSRDAGIPTAFWNKEDPIHMESFLRVAAEFDFVFTTDIDCVQQYTALLGHRRVRFLPFAAQPGLQTPMETQDRKQAMVFAGSYYTRYTDRMRNLRALVDGVSEVVPVEIYDRNLGTTLPDYAFPEEYEPLIVGTLRPQDIDIAYKGYRFALNMNSVKGSQSMFARRVYELLASGTVTISNYARGLKLIFGDLVPMTDSRTQIAQRMRGLVDDLDSTDRLRAAGLRKVLDEHTYRDRLRYVAHTLFNLEYHESEAPHVLVVAAAQDETALDVISDAIQRQAKVDARLVVITDDLKVKSAADAAGHMVRTAAQANEGTLDSIADAGTVGVALFDAADWYGEHYLRDLVDAWRFVDVDVVGKQTYFAVADDEVTTVHSGAEYRPLEHASPSRALVRFDKVRHESVGALLNRSAYDLPGAAIHRFDYVRGAAHLAGQSQLDRYVADVDLDHGIPLMALYKNVNDTLSAHEPQESDLLDLSILRAGTSASNRDEVTTAYLQDGSYRVVSTLDEDEPLTMRKSPYVPVEMLWPDGVATVAMTTMGKATLTLMVFYFDSEWQLLRRQVIHPGVLHRSALPEGTTHVRFAVRTVGPGMGRILRVHVGEWQFEPDIQVSTKEVLAVTDNYPSDDDLYRNGFLHSRIRQYRERGVGADVYRLRKGKPLTYHEFEGVEVATGSVDGLRVRLETGSYHSIAVHFMNAWIWQSVCEHHGGARVVVWVHGAEIQAWWRRSFNYETPEELERAKQRWEERREFWAEVLSNNEVDLHLVFVSQYLVREVEEDLGITLDPNSYSVIHNPIDTELFSFEPKPIEQRKKILSLRPYASKIYANDLAVQAVLDLADEPFFNDLEFRFIGDGMLFEETLEPLRGFENVTIERRFLRQREIAELYRDYGVMLIPTRSDTHGVSRDESMAAGLVPVSSNIAAVPEFVSDHEGFLAPYEDHQGLADAISRLYRDPDLFQRMSAAAAQRVRGQASAHRTVPLELDKLAGK